jgi:hypothetical protein
MQPSEDANSRQSNVNLTIISFAWCMPMEAVDDDDVTSDEEEKIETIYRLELTQTSREAYRARLQHFVSYLRRTDPDLVLDDYSFDLKRLHLKQFFLFLLFKQDEDRASFATLEVLCSFFAVRVYIESSL